MFFCHNTLTINNAYYAVLFKENEHNLPYQALDKLARVMPFK